MKRFFHLFLFLLLFPLSSLAITNFDYPSRVALPPGEESYTLFTQINYYLDLDTSLYSWSSPDDEMNVQENGLFSCRYAGKYRVIGTPKEPGLNRISFVVRYPDFAYSSDRVDITSPDGAFHAFKLQQNGISGLDWKTSGGVFKAEMASRENPLGPNALHLIPKKPGKGKLTYITHTGARFPIDVVVHESAFSSSTPVPSPTSTPVSSTPSPVPSASSSASEEILPHPSEYSGSTLRKIYEPYNYHLAKTSPTSYKNTSVYFSGTVLIYNIMDDGWGYALVLCEGEGDKPVYITLPPGCLGDSGIDFGDDIEVYGVTYGMTETGIEYPAILTTMQLVNHGDNGLFPDLVPSSTITPDSPDHYTFTRTTKGANLRSEPRADSRRVFSVKQGERLKVIVPNYVNGWHQVEFRGKICYISAKLVDLK